MYEFSFRKYPRKGEGVVGFETFRHCFTALVMATCEMNSKQMISSTMWTCLYLLNAAVEGMDELTQDRWGYLSSMSVDELRDRWNDPGWPGNCQPVDILVDDPPF